MKQVARGALGALLAVAVVVSCRGTAGVVPAAAQPPAASPTGTPVAIDAAPAKTPSSAPSRTTATKPAAKPNAPAGKAPANTVEPAKLDVAPPLPREFRGVWVASVANIDWPSKRTLSTAEQQAELIALLDRAVALKLNAVIFQVRPAADALYASRIEPWSEYLTGAQGRKPDPYWDPLEFVIKESHARNLELHAWFNPYRARHTDAKAPLAPSHIAKTNPQLIKSYGGYLWMDPGEAAVRSRTLRVVMDVVRRYDIDGVHIDDYFYPYPVTDRRGRAVAFPDDRSWQRYRSGGGTLARDDWRRRNVDLLVQSLHDSIHVAKPWVRFGISPFGIWRPGYPEQIRGFDAYAKLYADARKWLREGWLDYFTPQLYWPTTKAPQSYPVLLDWWASENVHDRHLWPGNFTSRAGATGSGAFPVSELVEQIRVTRKEPRATGNVHFSMKSFLTNQAQMNDALLAGPYASLALTPATPWLKVAAPPVPAVSATPNAGAWQVQLSTYNRTAPWQWAVRLRADTGWVTMLLPGTTNRWTIPRTMGASALTVTALNRVGTESPPVTVSLSTKTSSTSTSPSSSRRTDGR